MAAKDLNELEDSMGGQEKETAAARAMVTATNERIQALQSDGRALRGQIDPIRVRVRVGVRVRVRVRVSLRGQIDPNITIYGPITLDSTPLDAGQIDPNITIYGPITIDSTPLDAGQIDSTLSEVQQALAELSPDVTETDARSSLHEQVSRRYVHIW